MNNIRFKVLLFWLLCVLVVVATTASVMATHPTAASPQSLSAAMSPAPAIVKGAVTYREPGFPNGQGTLIGNQVLTVQLVDITKADAPAVVLGEQIIQTTGRPFPFGFEIRYDPASIKPNGVYGVEANVTVDGKLMFQATTTQVMITQDHPTMVEVMLAKAGPWSSFDPAIGEGRLAHFSY
jgi:uncharacterized lipoprotein YbaY